MRVWGPGELAAPPGYMSATVAAAPAALSATMHCEAEDPKEGRAVIGRGAGRGHPRSEEGRGERRALEGSRGKFALCALPALHPSFATARGREQVGTFLSQLSQPTKDGNCYFSGKETL